MGVCECVDVWVGASICVASSGCVCVGASICVALSVCVWVQACVWWRACVQVQLNKKLQFKWSNIVGEQFAAKSFFRVLEANFLKFWTQKHNSIATKKDESARSASFVGVQKNSGRIIWQENMS